jgi:peptidoglycan/LPS O-acetylase OafA/YrhL
VHASTLGLGGGRTIGDRVGAGPNALTFLRLVLALEVVAWHAYALRGDAWLPGQLGFLSDIAVDSFFAISGFLICSAWFRNPSFLRFAEARARRLLPALFVCLVATAFVIAPLSLALAGQPELSLGAQADYVLSKATMSFSGWGIEGSPAGVPHPGVWNGSLWSLTWEVVAYGAVAALGVLALLRLSVVLWLAGVLWLGQLVLVVADSWVVGTSFAPWALPRTGLMFACGALLYLLRDRIPVSGAAALAALGVFAVGVAVTPSYRFVVPPALAYLCLYLGIVLGRFPRLVLRTDLSYGIYIYAFPIQQSLLLLGLGSIGWMAFTGLSILAVLPLAVASWLAVERPFLKRGRRARTPAAEPRANRPVLETH